MRPSEIEKAKLTATYANGVAIALAAIGGIAPWVTLVVQPSAGDISRIAISGGICFLLSYAIHLLGRRVLDRLDGS